MSVLRSLNALTNYNTEHLTTEYFLYIDGNWDNRNFLCTEVQELSKRLNNET